MIDLNRLARQIVDLNSTQGVELSHAIDQVRRMDAQTNLKSAESPTMGQSTGDSSARLAGAGSSPISTGALSLDNIEDAMNYQPWDSRQQDQGNQVRDALLAAAKAILRNVPSSPRRTLALQHLISARMDANCSISFHGRF